jgi:predicted nucleic-acid-binding protein
MIGLDTNILVRYLTQDDPLQSPKATEIIERRLTEETPGFVSIVAMVETVWVLDRSYRLPAHKIAAAVERMLQTDVLVIENEQEVFTAIHRHDRTQGGAGLVRRCCHRCTRRQSRLLLHPDIRPQGGAATRLRTRLTCAVLARSIFSSD